MCRNITVSKRLPSAIFVVILDSTAPYWIYCPIEVILYSDINQTYTNRLFELPTAADSEEDRKPKVRQTAGTYKQSNRISDNEVHTVQYVAFDSTFNPSHPCTFPVKGRGSSDHYLMFPLLI